MSENIYKIISTDNSGNKFTEFSAKVVKENCRGQVRQRWAFSTPYLTKDGDKLVFNPLCEENLEKKFVSISKVINKEFCKFIISDALGVLLFLSILFAIITWLIFANIFPKNYVLGLLIGVLSAPLYIFASLGLIKVLHFFIKTEPLSEQELSELLKIIPMSKEEAKEYLRNMRRQTISATTNSYVSNRTEHAIIKSEPTKAITLKDRVNKAYQEQYNSNIKDSTGSDFPVSEKTIKAISAITKMNLQENLDWMLGKGFSDEDLEQTAKNIEVREQKKLENHLSYEGRIKTGQKIKIKNILGYNCMACGMCMDIKYGTYGKNYIELHHKIPYANMKETEERILDVKDFCVLCPNCHRMIHKLDDQDNLDLLKNIIDLNKLIRK